MSEQEKVCINLSVVNIGQIDLLVNEGFYSNRTDFIKDAIRQGLDLHRDKIDEKIRTNNFVVGILSFTRTDLEKAVSSGMVKDVFVVGMLLVRSDITPELAEAAFGRVTVYGVIKAEERVKAILEQKRTPEVD